MSVPDLELRLLNGLEMQADAEPQFDLLKYCLVWEDERPSVPMSSQGTELLTDLWIARGFIHREQPAKKWGRDGTYFPEVWEYGRRMVPGWPGFRRIALSDVDRQYLAKSLKISLSEL